MADTLTEQIRGKFLMAGAALLTVLCVGTAGYWFIGGKQYHLLDCLYMTVITITTIGYGEIVDLSGNHGGRIFTMFIAMSGIGIITYILSSVTAFVIEGDINEAFRRRKMEKMIRKLRDHYIVCGADGVGYYILAELSATERPHVLIDISREKMEKVPGNFPGEFFIEGDATDNDVLLSAGIREAKGIFAVTGDDNENLVISLTAKQLNPEVRVVACCQDIRNMEKMKKAGADTVVSPTYIGGLRMASEMIRPAVVSFLDAMLRDKEKKMRIEEVVVHSPFERSLESLRLKSYRHSMLLAVKSGGDIAYNPQDDHVVKTGDTLIFLTTPEERKELEKVFAR